MVAVSSARRSGWHSGSTCTAVPILSRLVRAAIAAATVSGALRTERAACWWISASQIASSPQRSASDDLLERLRERIGVGLLIHLAVEFMVPAELHVPPSVAFGA